MRYSTTTKDYKPMWVIKFGFLGQGDVEEPERMMVSPLRKDGMRKAVREGKSYGTMVADKYCHEDEVKAWQHFINLVWGRIEKRQDEIANYRGRIASSERRIGELS